MKTTLLSAAVVAAAATAVSPAFAGAVLDKIRANDQLVCGVNTSAPGFSSADSKGHWEGLDVNLCRQGEVRSFEFYAAHDSTGFRPD